MAAALLERVGKLADAVTEKVVIRKPAPVFDQDCGLLGDPCHTFADCCQLIGLQACIAGICVT
ncbi:hypothetical protein ACFY97_20475 [Streptomyces klenkii]|uniref:hypothetical protein n=1 Tax=Streptomyces klenkii TaxID=1420899 RepID=UPI0036DFD3F2